MPRTIREAHKQNIQLLARLSQFNEELTRGVEAATSELAKRNAELRLLNEALFESQRQLGQAEKLAALGEATAAMAHHIGTPLNSISGYIQLLLQGKNLEPAVRDRLRIIDAQLDQLTDSVKNLLSVTRRPKAQMKSLDVNTILTELIHLSEPWIHTRDVKLVSSMSPHLSPVLGDPSRLQTLFLNLISNALDAMPRGGALTIKTRMIPPRSSAKHEKWAEVSVADTGTGIAEESKKRIFEPFFTTKRTGEGTGLGLTICEKIVKEHLGTLEVKSEVGKGSTFFVRIPLPEGTRPHG